MKVIVETLQESVNDNRRKWDQRIKNSAIRVGQLKKAEEKARENFHPSVQRVTGGKETLFMKELLSHMWYPDCDIADGIKVST